MGWLTGLLGRVAAKLVGPRVLLGLLIAAAAGLAFVTWRWVDAVDEAAVAEGVAQQYRDAHRTTVKALTETREEMKRRERIAAETRARARERAAEVASLRDALDQARRGGSDAYRECLDVRLPGALRERLRDYGSDPDTDGDAD